MLLICSLAEAKIWRLNNRPEVTADFTTFQNALAAASPGDTIYVEPSPNNYGDITVDKHVVIVGSGYWLDQNDSTQAYKELSKFTSLTFNSGSENSVVTGMHISKSGTNTNLNTIVINTDSITITRCYIKVWVNDYNSLYDFSGRAIRVNGNRSNIIISQNWIDSSTNYTSYTRTIDITGIQSNMMVSNNFIRAHGSNPTAFYMSENQSTQQVALLNNVIWGNLVTYYCQHVNNILLTGSYNNSSNDLTFNNLCNSSQYPAINNNQQNVDMSTVFIDYQSYIDNGYQLESGSPATGTGLNGGDCGAFGHGSGGDPYVLSGMPAIPAIFEAQVNPVGSGSVPLEVQIKAKSHN